MPNQHKRRPLSFRPTPEQQKRLNDYSQETGTPVNCILRDGIDLFFAAKHAAGKWHEAGEPWRGDQYPVE